MDKNSKITLVFVSDTHMAHNHLVMPDGDILIHSGDATNQGSINELTQFNVWLKVQTERYKHVVFIPGNHDRIFEKSYDLARIIIDKKVHILIDEMIELEGIKIYGSPWTPEFMNWSFQLQNEQESSDRWNRIPENVDVLVTHGPPYGVMDTTSEDGKIIHVGDRSLAARVLEVKPSIHSFGHIHNNHGQMFFNGIQYINAVSSDLRKPLPNNPIVVVIDCKEEQFS